MASSTGVRRGGGLGTTEILRLAPPGGSPRLLFSGILKDPWIFCRLQSQLGPFQSTVVRAHHHQNASRAGLGCIRASHRCRERESSVQTDCPERPQSSSCTSQRRNALSRCCICPSAYSNILGLAQPHLTSAGSGDHPQDRRAPSAAAAPAWKSHPLMQQRCRPAHKRCRDGVFHLLILGALEGGAAFPYRMDGRQGWRPRGPGRGSEGVHRRTHRRHRRR